MKRNKEKTGINFNLIMPVSIVIQKSTSGRILGATSLVAVVLAVIKQLFNHA
jgi:hypothetical protein